MDESPGCSRLMLLERRNIRRGRPHAGCLVSDTQLRKFVGRNRSCLHDLLILNRQLPGRCYTTRGCSSLKRGVISKRCRELQLKYACVLQKIGTKEMDSKDWGKAIEPLTQCWLLRRQLEAPPSETWETGDALAMCYLQTKQWRQSIEVNSLLHDMLPFQ